MPCFLIALLCLLLGGPAMAQPVLACADTAEMPPFTYRERVAGKESERVTGVAVDLLKQLGARAGWQVDVHLLPWRRCLAYLRSGQYQIGLNVGRAEGGALLLSRPYFTVHNMYFYSSRVHPEGLKIRNLDDVSRYHLCGLAGYRFEPFGIRTEQADSSSTSTYEQLIGKLHLGRCDLFIDTREAFAGMYLLNPKLGPMLVDRSLVSMPLPGSPSHQLYFAVSGAYPQLLKELNAGLAQFEKNKVVDKLLDKYLQ